jgi:hypothetical protein
MSFGSCGERREPSQPEVEETFGLRLALYRQAEVSIRIGRRDSFPRNDPQT